MPRAERVLQAVVSTPWAIMPEKLEAILEILELRMAGVHFSPDELAARIEASREDRPEPKLEGKVAVLPVFGVMARRMNMMTEMSGGVSLELWRRNFDVMLADPEVKAIVLQVDSPGGEVAGTQELAEYVYSNRKKKRLIAVADTLAASAAYWLAAAAEEVVVSPSGYVGSVGVFALHIDQSEAMQKAGLKATIIRAGRYKAEGLPLEPLKEETKEFMQAQADRIYDTFVKALATYRGVSVKAVRDDFGQGRVVDAETAKTAGMVDRVATFEEVLGRLGVGAVGVGNVRRARAQHVERMAKLEEGLYPEKQG